MIKVENLTKSYNGEICFEDLSFSIPKGEFFTLMGENGSGKTTLIEIISGIRNADSGKVTVAGKNIFELSDGELSKFRRTKIGVVYQDFELIPTLSVGDNIMLPMLLERTPKQEILPKMLEICKKLGIDTMLEKYPEELSGGQRRRASIARAVCHLPELLLLDEPTSGLDEYNASRVNELLLELNQRENITVFQISHSEMLGGIGRTVRFSELKKKK